MKKIITCSSKLSQNFQRSNQITTVDTFCSMPLPFKVISKFSKKQPNHNNYEKGICNRRVQSYLKIFKEATKSQPLGGGHVGHDRSKLSQNFQRSNQITTLLAVHM